MNYERQQSAVALYRSGLSVPSIAQTLAVHRNTIWKDLRAIREPLHLPDLCGRATVFTTKEHEIIEGLMLGDGSMECQEGHSTPRLSLISTEHEFTCYVENSMGLQFHKHERPQGTQTLNGHIYNKKRAWVIRSLTDKGLWPYRSRWYGDSPDHRQHRGVKRVPEDLVLTPLVMRIWMYGDGSTSRYDTLVKLELSTDGFSDRCRDILQAKLLDVSGDLQFRVAKTGALWSSRINTVRAFFEHAGACGLACYRYKWKLPDNAWPATAAFGTLPDDVTAVRLVVPLFKSGLRDHQVADVLVQEAVPTRKGKLNWHQIIGNIRKSLCKQGLLT